MKAIILAGGKGSRLRPLTDTIPKALVPVGEITLIELVINSLPETIDTAIITTKYLPHLIEERIGATYAGKEIRYAAQPHDQDGTWAALYCARTYIDTDEPFLVLNCDDLFDADELQKLCESPVIGMGVTRRTMPAKYHGMQVIDGLVTGFHRHTDTDRETSIEDLFANGLYILDRKIFTFEPVTLTDGELGLPHTLLAKKDTYPLHTLELTQWQPCNSFEDLEKIKMPQ